MGRDISFESARRMAGLHRRFDETKLFKFKKRMAAAAQVGPETYTVTPVHGEALTVIESGRNRWALERLRAAGLRGCTPANDPGPRWSTYVKNLRSLGIEISTVHEKHGGTFPSIRGRYVLLSGTTRTQPSGAEYWFRMLYLRWFFGLSKAQASGIAPLIWGAGK